MEDNLLSSESTDYKRQSHLKNTFTATSRLVFDQTIGQPWPDQIDNIEFTITSTIPSAPAQVGFGPADCEPGPGVGRGRQCREG